MGEGLKSPEQRLKSLNKDNNILIATTFMMFAFLMVLVFLNLRNENFMELKVVNETTLNFDVLTDSEVEIALDILKDVKPKYLKFIHSINFVRNLSVIRGGKRTELLGLNKYPGDLYILYTNENIMKQTICHEILHSYIYPDEVSHKIIYDLERILPCYKK